jgi:hypothetical protein
MVEGTITKVEKARTGVFTIVFGLLCLLMTGFVGYMIAISPTDSLMSTVLVTLVFSVWLSFANTYMVMRILNRVE